MIVSSKRAYPQEKNPSIAASLSPHFFLMCILRAPEQVWVSISSGILTESCAGDFIKKSCHPSPVEGISATKAASVLVWVR